MKYLVLALLLSSSASAQFATKVNEKDSSDVMSKLQGCWKSKNVQFTMDFSKSIVFDTFNLPSFQVLEPKNSDTYLAWKYQMQEYPKTRVFIINLSSSENVSSDNSDYILQTEFILYNKKLYYNREGIIMEFTKLKQ